MRKLLRDLLKRKPFQPFEVRLSNGDKFQVRHPEFAMLLKSQLIVGVPDTDEVIFCALLHVADVKQLADGKLPSVRRKR